MGNTRNINKQLTVTTKNSIFRDEKNVFFRNVSVRQTYLFQVLSALVLSMLWLVLVCWSLGGNKSGFFLCFVGLFYFVWLRVFVWLRIFVWFRFCFSSLNKGSGELVVQKNTLNLAIYLDIDDVPSV